MKILWSATCALLLLTQLSSGQNRDPLWAGLTTAANALREVPAEPAPKRALDEHATRIGKSASTLENATRGKELPKLFRESVVKDTDALNSVTRERGPIDRAVRIAGGVADDLEVKTSFVIKGGAPARDVDVDAYTKEKGIVRNGYEVWAAPWALRDNPGERYRFNGHSSPAKRPLSAGRWAMWSAVPNGGAPGTQQQIDVGPGGKTSQDVDVPIPEPGKK